MVLSVEIHHPRRRNHLVLSVQLHAAQQLPQVLEVAEVFAGDHFAGELVRNLPRLVLAAERDRNQVRAEERALGRGAADRMDDALGLDDIDPDEGQEPEENPAA
ncbi:hypothetical protein [Streptomyces sp. NPDC058757]|uniref:hypothetical protein n=1 Tax=Streptomyces sp. NPDC058757 TaxID=3346626 RepID=UPI003675668A